MICQQKTPGESLFIQQQTKRKWKNGKLPNLITGSLKILKRRIDVNDDQYVSRMPCPIVQVLIYQNKDAGPF